MHEHDAFIGVAVGGAFEGPAVICQFQVAGRFLLDFAAAFAGHDADAAFVLMAGDEIFDSVKHLIDREAV